jgi:hypothetical protein
MATDPDDSPASSAPGPEPAGSSAGQQPAAEAEPMGSGHSDPEKLSTEDLITRLREDQL